MRLQHFPHLVLSEPIFCNKSPECSIIAVMPPPPSKKRVGTQTSQSAGVPMEFRKTNEAIGLRIREGKLSLLSRLLYNVMMYHAQQMKEPGKNAPIDSEVNRLYFWIPLSEVARDASYASKDTEHLKRQIEEFQNLKIYLEDENQWTSESLVSSVKLLNTSGLNRQGGTVWFGYAFPPEVHQLVMNPETYTKLSLYYQGLLRSGSSLALYEICRRYATNPSHLTRIESTEYWHAVLTGNPMSEVAPEYKYFKRDVLKPSIAEINTATDIKIELIEHKRGRFIERLQFRVHLVSQANLDLPAPPVINTRLIADLQKCGFTQQEAADLTAQHPEDRLRSSLEIVLARMDAPTLSVLDSPAAYFRWHLRKGVVVQPLDKEPVALSTNSAPSLMERFLTARARDAMALHEGLSSDQAATLVDEFKRSDDAKGLKFEKGIDTPMGRSLFGRWYALRTWGAPTAEALSAFEGQLTV